MLSDIKKIPPIEAGDDSRKILMGALCECTALMSDIN